MAYRLTDTNKWADGWFIDLDSCQKLLFLYLCDSCDIAGFCELSTRKIAFDLSLTADQVKIAMRGIDRCYILSQDKGVLFLKNFLKHQKNTPLNTLNKAHIAISRRFMLYRSRFELDLISLFNCQPIIDLNARSTEGGSMGDRRVPGIGIGNKVVLKERKDTEEKEENPFESFWDPYPKKVDKAKAAIVWKKITQTDRKIIIEVLPRFSVAMAAREKSKILNPTTFLNGRRWEDDLSDGKVLQMPPKFSHVPSKKIQEKLNRSK